MASEITQEEDEENSSYIVDKEAEKQKIRHIIDYQKSLYFSSSSSSSSSFSASRSSLSSPGKSRNLLGLMKEGSTSLRRLFDMEHTSLGNYFNDYSGSPIIKPILLWGSDSDDGIHDDPWMEIKQIKGSSESRIDDQTRVVSSKGNSDDQEIIHKRMSRIRRRKLTRTKSYKRLPRFVFWRFGGFRFRLRKLKVMICGRKF